MQTISLGNPFINLKGEWEEDKEYEHLDAVTNRGSLFIANKRFVPAGTEPGKDNAWLLSARGEDEEVTKELIQNALSEHEALSTKNGAHDFPEYKEGQLLTVKEGELAFTNDYRIPITKDTTWYVRADGDDTNDGSEDTPEKAFKTIQGCLDYLYSHYVQAHRKIIIRIGEGEFDGFELLEAHIGIHDIFLYGAGTDKTIITNNGTSNKGCINIGSYKRALLQDIKLLFDDSIGLTGDTPVIFSDLYSYVNLSGCLIETKESIGTYYIYIGYASNYSTLEFSRNTEFITRSTVTTSKIGIILMNRHSTVTMYNTITANGKTAYFLQANDFSYFYCPASTQFVGTMTGTRYLCYTSSIVNTKGLGTNTLPGDTAGTLASGATYY